MLGGRRPCTQSSLLSDGGDLVMFDLQGRELARRAFEDFHITEMRIDMDLLFTATSHGRLGIYRLPVRP